MIVLKEHNISKYVIIVSLQNKPAQIAKSAGIAASKPRKSAQTIKGKPRKSAQTIKGKPLKVNHANQRKPRKKRKPSKQAGRRHVVSWHGRKATPKTEKKVRQKA